MLLRFLEESRAFTQSTKFSTMAIHGLIYKANINYEIKHNKLEIKNIIDF